MTKTYTKYQRREIAKVFKAAQEYLWDGVNMQDHMYRPEFICVAIDYLTIDDLYNSTIAGIRAKEIIMDRIAPCYTVSQWLAKYGKIPLKDLTRKRVQQHRKDWLEMLYNEFSYNPQKRKALT